MGQQRLQLMVIRDLPMPLVVLESKLILTIMFRKRVQQFQALSTINQHQQQHLLLHRQVAPVISAASIPQRRSMKSIINHTNVCLIAMVDTIPMTRHRLWLLK